jgi:aspartate racemase
MNTYSVLECAAGPLWGILGGMGPLASADFVKTVYESCLGECEQQHPRLILLSDPTVPDRSEALAQKRGAILGERLAHSLANLLAQGATDTVICCVTLHAVLPSVPSEYKRGLHSLVTTALEHAAQAQGPHLLVCTTGTRSSGTFQADPLWSVVRKNVILPDAVDQEHIHTLLYEIKRNRFAPDQVELLEHLLRKYRAKSYLAGCTELHCLERWRRDCGLGGFACIDPLLILARRIAAVRAAAEV